MSADSQTRYGICTFCDSVCGLEFEVRGRDIVSIRGDAQDVFSRGHLCPKGVAQKDVHHDPDRLRRPIEKVDGEWREISWDAAYARLAQTLVSTQRAHGSDAVGFYYGNPTGHDYKSMFAVLGFARLLGSRNVFSSNSVDAHPRMLVSMMLYGNQGLLPVPDIERTDELVIMGANPVISHGSVMTAPDTKKRLAAIRARGGRIVVIDPRRTETAAIADAHVAIRPGTDALLLFSVLHALDRGGWIDPTVRERTFGIDALLRLARRFPAEKTAARTGVSPATVRALAESFGKARAAVWYGRMGTSTQAFGCVSTWLIDAINIVTGNFDRPGGAMFATPAVDLASVAKAIRETGDFDRWRSRVGGLPEFNGEFPVAALADEIETPGTGQVRAMLVFAGNPVLSNPNGRRLDRALEKLEFLACVDFYLNETTRHADLILPPVGPLERGHYPVLELAMGVRNVARYAPPVIPPVDGHPDDAAILGEVAVRVLRARGGLHRAASVAARATRRLIESERLLDLMLRTGPHRLRLTRVKAATHGIDLGPLEPRLDQVLCTKSGRVELAPPRFVADVERLAATVEPENNDERRPLSLVSRRTLKSMNSWLNNAPLLVKGRARCTLQVHPADADAHGVGPNDRVTVRSRVGEIEVPVEITDAMMPGVVSLPYGWGHDREGTQLRVARRHAGASMNDLADERAFDAVSGTSILDGIPVSIAVVEEVAP